MVQLRTSGVKMNENWFVMLGMMDMVEERYTDYDDDYWYIPDNEFYGIIEDLDDNDE